MATKRKEDINGWWEIKHNPVSKAGVFPYLGSEIPGAPDPKKIYYVARLPEELGSPEALESYKLLPWIDEHAPAFLGSTDIGGMPAEEKGVQGTTGQEVSFENDTVYLNIKLFSESLKNEIENNKEELSMGYRCIFVPESGTFNGQRYDYVQRHIRGNHLALVEDGRMGSEVAVLDHAKNIYYQSFAVDSKEILKMVEKTDKEKVAATNDADTSTEGGSETEPTLSEVNAQIKAFAKQIAEINASLAMITSAKAPEAPASTDATSADAGSTDGDKPAMAMDTASEIKKLATKVDEQSKLVAAQDSQIAELKKNSFGTIMKEVNDRNSLYEQVSPIAGAFDHNLMTKEQVAAKSIELLNGRGFSIKAEPGNEFSVLSGFLAAQSAAQPVFAFAGDKSTTAKSDELDAYINGSGGTK